MIKNTRLYRGFITQSKTTTLTPCNSISHTHAERSTSLQGSGSESRLSGRSGEQQSTSGADTARKCGLLSRRTRNSWTTWPNYGPYQLPLDTFPRAHYRDYLAGGRLIALSKHLKPGVRPICISDAIRRLVADGLFACCNASFTSVFKNSHPRALRFGANLENGATHMFHLIAGVLHSTSECTDDDPIASLDLKNAFNTIEGTLSRRAYLTKLFWQNQQSAAHSCLLSHEARPDSNPIDLGHNILWKHFQRPHILSSRDHSTHLERVGGAAG